MHSDCTLVAATPGIREFGTGATRDTAAGKFGIEGYLSPEVLDRYYRYMEKNQHLGDGTVRGSDNWQSMFGPTPEAHCQVCLESLLRHVHDLWLFHRGAKGRDTIEDALAGILFNAHAYWFGIIKKEKSDGIKK